MLKGQTMNQRLRKILLYLILTFSINFAMVAIFLAAGGKPGGTGMILLAMAYMLVPMIVTILVQKFIYKQLLVKPFGISFTVNRWFFVAWFTPPLIAFATMGINRLIRTQLSIADPYNEPMDKLAKALEEMENDPEFQEKERNREKDRLLWSTPAGY